jgi:hypothetical protein
VRFSPGRLNGALLYKPKKSNSCTNEGVHKGVYAEGKYSLPSTVLPKTWAKTLNPCRIPERTIEARVYWEIGFYYGLFGELAVSRPG